MFTLWQFLAAAALGALHALEPGHGKAIMGAYLAGSRATWRDAVLLGLTAALTHCASVVLLALGLHGTMYVLSRQSGASAIPWEKVLQQGSGLLICLLGLHMLRRAWHLNIPSCSCAACAGTPPARDRSAALVGMATGLLPCPSAVSVLLLGLSSGTPGPGLLYVGAFGLGSALALMATGLLFIALGQSLHRRGLGLSRVFGVLSGLLVLGLGVYTVLGG
ncbi:urease accessory protein UreH domain-containing protein [Desulfurispora thermophila]|uniref:HoxN/HupN/NixA family nickel/cobalt transporter n=1 Tax=Desulfurispora thermophila TaxID=265470 RepID=UPI000360F539|nr:sulfite exporter TauE/SafE family protein [Desulfurispora thermophila]